MLASMNLAGNATVLFKVLEKTATVFNQGSDKIWFSFKILMVGLSIDGGGAIK